MLAKKCNGKHFTLVAYLTPLAALWQLSGNVLAAAASAATYTAAAASAATYPAATASAANDTNIKCHKVWRLCRGLSTTHKYAQEEAVRVGVCVCV